MKNAKQNKTSKAYFLWPKDWEREGLAQHGLGMEIDPYLVVAELERGPSHPAHQVQFPMHQEAWGVLALLSSRVSQIWWLLAHHSVSGRRRFRHRHTSSMWLEDSSGKIFSIPWVRDR